MSIRNYNIVILIKNLTTGDIEPVHDYFRYDKGIQEEMLHRRLDKYLQDNQNVAIEYVKEVDKYSV